MMSFFAEWVQIQKLSPPDSSKPKLGLSLQLRLFLMRTSSSVLLGPVENKACVYLGGGFCEQKETQSSIQQSFHTVPMKRGPWHQMSISITCDAPTKAMKSPELERDYWRPRACISVENFLPSCFVSFSPWLGRETRYQIECVNQEASAWLQT